MWSDSDTSRDFLNFSCIAETAAELIVQANGHPLSVGVSGGWGVGKSSMLRLINDALKSRDEDPSGYLFVTFNAWLYQGYDDARAALVVEVGDHDEHPMCGERVYGGAADALRPAGDDRHASGQVIECSHASPRSDSSDSPGVAVYGVVNRRYGAAAVGAGARP